MLASLQPLSYCIIKMETPYHGFSYTDVVVSCNSNAPGLTCEYRWEIIDGQPRVVEHQTSDGEHFHFCYDREARTTWVTDVLGRELEIHYNKDHRVTSSRDYIGDHYVIEIDALGHKTEARSGCTT